MSIVIKSNEFNYKDPTTGQYIGLNVLAEKKTSEILTKITNLGQEVIGSIPADYMHLSESLATIYDSTKTYKIGDIVYGLDYVPGSNVFDPNTVTSGKRIWVSDGELYNYTNGGVSDYIPVEYGQKVYLNYEFGSSSYGHGFYDSNKTYVSGIVGSDVPTDGIIDVPSGAAYFRAGYTNTVFSTIEIKILDIVKMLYNCVSDIATPEVWNSDHWQLITLGDAISKRPYIIPPVLDGTYKLVCTVNNGVATYSWVTD